MHAHSQPSERSSANPLSHPRPPIHTPPPPPLALKGLGSARAQAPAPADNTRATPAFPADAPPGPATTLFSQGSYSPAGPEQGRPDGCWVWIGKRGANCTHHRDCGQGKGVAVLRSRSGGQLVRRGWGGNREPRGSDSRGTQLFRASSPPSTARAHKRAPRGAVHLPPVPGLVQPSSLSSAAGKGGHPARGGPGGDRAQRGCPPARRVAVAAGAPAGCAVSAVSTAGGGGGGLTLGLQTSPRSSAAAVLAPLPP